MRATAVRCRASRRCPSFTSSILPPASAARGNSTIAARVKRANASACRVVVSPLHGHGNGDERVVAFVVIIYGPDERREISPAVLRELYGLTRAQADVAADRHDHKAQEERLDDAHPDILDVQPFDHRAPVDP